MTHDFISLGTYRMFPAQPTCSETTLCSVTQALPASLYLPLPVPLPVPVPEPEPVPLPVHVPVPVPVPAPVPIPVPVPVPAPVSSEVQPWKSLLPIDVQQRLPFLVARLPPSLLPSSPPSYPRSSPSYPQASPPSCQEVQLQVIGGMRGLLITK